MAKTQTAKEQPDPALLVVTNTPPRKKRGKPVAIEQHTVTTQWAEEKVIGDKPKPRRPAPPIDDPEADEDEDAPELEPPEDLQEAFEQDSVEVGWKMEINRLPNYHLNGKYDPASRSYCGERDYTGDYKQVLRLYYAREGVPNYFYLRFKGPDTKYVDRTIGPILIEPATAEEKAQHGIIVQPVPVTTTATINQATPVERLINYEPPAPADPMAGINQTLQLLEKFQSIGLIPKLERNKQEPVVVQNPQGELTEEAILLKAAMSAPEVQDRVRSSLGRLIGEQVAPESPWWGEAAVGMLGNFLNAIGPGVNAWLTTMANARQVELQQAQVKLQTITPTNGTEHAHQVQQLSQTVPAAPPMQQVAPQPEQPAVPVEYLHFFQEVYRIKRLALPPGMNAAAFAAEQLMQWMEQHDEQSGEEVTNKYAPIMNEFLNAEPAVLQGYAAWFLGNDQQAVAVISAEDVPGWIAGLQTELRKEWESGEDTNGSQN